MTKYIKETTSTHSRVSDYKGVKWCKKAEKWNSYITESGIRHECGYYSSEREAAKARDLTIIKKGLKAKLQILSKV